MQNTYSQVKAKQRDRRCLGDPCHRLGFRWPQVSRVRSPKLPRMEEAPRWLTMIMPVRVAFWANWKSSRSLMFLMASVTCTTLFMKASLRQMSCDHDEGQGGPCVGEPPKTPRPSPCSRTLGPHRTPSPLLGKYQYQGHAERRPPRSALQQPGGDMGHALDRAQPPSGPPEGAAS